MTRAGRLETRRPLWQEVGLTAAFTAALVAFAAAATWVGSRFLTTGNGIRAFTILVVAIAVAFLVHYAYPPASRRWWRFALFELCVVLIVPVWVPLVYLPWLIVTGKARQAAGGRSARAGTG